MYPNVQKNRGKWANYLGVAGLSIFPFTTIKHTPKYMNIYGGITYILCGYIQNH